MMQVETARFGPLEIKTEDILRTREGLPGFEHLHEYILLPVQGVAFFYWLQSLEEPEIAFLLADPFNFFAGYSVDLKGEWLEKLRITTEEQVAIYTIVTIPAGSIREATCNLAGPLVFNLPGKEFMQVIIDEPGYHTRHRLFPRETAGQESR